MTAELDLLLGELAELTGNDLTNEGGV